MARADVPAVLSVLDPGSCEQGETRSPDSRNTREMRSLKSAIHGRLTEARSTLTSRLARMTMAQVSERIRYANLAFAGVRDFYFNSRYSERRADPAIADFTFGNPHEMPLRRVGVDSSRPRHSGQQGLVRLQDQRGEGSRSRRGATWCRARPLIRPRRHRHDGRRFRAR